MFDLYRAILGGVIGAAIVLAVIEILKWVAMGAVAWWEWRKWRD